MVCVPTQVKVKGLCSILLACSIRKSESTSQRRNNKYPEDSFWEILLVIWGEKKKKNMKHSFGGFWSPRDSPPSRPKELPLL